ncbi:hypothetical protein [Streptomyces sp. V1I1]|uniref:hypothetical protein n=1 Tax=Streptomyces sp. V1I1 TaxID=3042272 RepID=UPI0027D7DB0B|nr:hypothetical protein [Streptomyces sp. V1I1]
MATTSVLKPWRWASKDVRGQLLATAEQLGIAGSDLAGLVEVYDGGDCAAVQARMAQLVTARLTAAESRIVELVEQAARVQSRTPGDRPGPPEDVARYCYPHRFRCRAMDEIASGT